VRRLVVVALLCALASGCGGAGERASAPPRPELPRTLALRLADESDAVASALQARLSEIVGKIAEIERADATASVSRVPPALQEPLSSGVNALVAQLPPCERLAPAPPTTSVPAQTETETEDHGKHGNESKKGKHGKHGKHGKQDEDG